MRFNLVVRVSRNRARKYARLTSLQWQHVGVPRATYMPADFGVGRPLPGLLVSRVSGP